MFSTKGLTLDLWLWCLFIGSSELLIGQLLALIPTRVPYLFRCLTEEAEEEDEEVSEYDPFADDGTRAKRLWMKSVSRLRTQVSAIGLIVALCHTN